MTNLFFIFEKSTQFGSMETCFVLSTDVLGVFTLLNERNRNNKTRVTAV